MRPVSDLDSAQAGLWLLLHFSPSSFFVTCAEYSSSFSCLPAAMLSVTHSGLTTCGFDPRLVASNLCVLFPLKCCDVRI
jgi:hypothetical protein